jgi:hypothetical protein
VVRERMGKYFLEQPPPKDFHERMFSTITCGSEVSMGLNSDYLTARTI